MTRYRFRIDTPWGKKGENVPRNSDGYCSQFCTHLVADEDFEKFPDLFEPVPEQDPVEKVAEWLGKEYCIDWKRFGNCRLIAAKLLDAGLDPEKLK